ncbi:hypothetical protein AB0O57_29025 [Streptomyces sp. NPDC091201]|uniref:hypothetical protein n=1 Tax=Streptomyces sp. NPDC091201 TaxID=3155190 RepID=UPI003434BF1B
MTTALTLAAPAPAVAATVAALLPTRRNRPWTTAPAAHAMRHGAPCTRLTDGVRALLVVEADDTRLEVYVERPGLYPYRADLVVDSSDPAFAAAHIAGRLLRWILPELDRDTSTAIAAADGNFHQVHQHHAQDMTELGYALLGGGAQPSVVDGVCGPGLIWQAEKGGIWAVRVVAGTMLASYRGPLGGLHGVLPLVLGPVGERVPSDTGSAFTRYLTDRYPQLSPVTPRSVSLNGYRDPGGYVSLAGRSAAPEHDRTDVVAEFSHVGVDLLLTAVPRLI